jgi:DNA-3-methyladenine glycosylase II
VILMSEIVRAEATMSPSRMQTQSELESAILVLTERCPDLARAHSVTGIPPIRHRSADFAGLVTIIVAQQVSTASARAIQSRIEDALGLVTPSAIEALDDEGLRGLGLSRPKVRTLRAVTEAISNGALEFATLDDLPDDDVRARLTAIKGIGPWTADIFLLFCLGRADVWPAGDLALMETVRMLRDLDALPQGDARIQHAENWRPYRGAAALLLWAYYAAVKRPGTLG